MAVKIDTLLTVPPHLAIAAGLGRKAADTGNASPSLRSRPKIDLQNLPKRARIPQRAFSEPAGLWRCESVRPSWIGPMGGLLWYDLGHQAIAVFVFCLDQKNSAGD
jgi:hypothetical protein